jgi:hypothetical protein
MVKSPWTSVAVPTDVPAQYTLAPGNTSASVPVTRPVIGWAMVATHPLAAIAKKKER